MRLLSRCNDDLKEYGPILTRLVEDCLAVVLAPEWPGAELMVTSFNGFFSKSLIDGKLGAPLLSLIVELIGKIFVSAQMEWQANAQSVNATPIKRTASPDDEGEVIACSCGEGIAHGHSF